MSDAARTHGEDHAELVRLYALQALPASELAAAKAQIASCMDCQHELETLRPIVESFVSWPTSILRPSAAVWERLAGRIAAETGGTPLPAASSRAPDPDWKDVAPGIACKLLATDPEKNRVSMLVRLAPGTDYPPHRHEGIEELYMLEGELRVDDKTFYPGDFRRGEPGTVDRRVWSETGCAAVLITSFRDAIL